MCRLLYLLFAFQTGSAYAELASDSTQNGRVHLFYAHPDGDMMRAICDQGSLVFDRSTCNNEHRRARLDKFFVTFANEYGSAIEPSTQKISGAWANIERIDARLRQLAADEPTTRPSPTLEEIHAAEIVIAEKDALLAEIRDQIARGEAALRLVGADPDILAQLAVLQIRRSDLEREVVGLRSNVTTMRQQYVAARVDDTDVDYRDLKRLRDEYVSQLEDGQHRLRDALDDRILGETILRRIREVGFTWVSLNSRPLAGVNRISSVFTNAELASRTYSAMDPGGPHTIRVPTPGGRLETINCLFYVPPVVSSGYCYVHFIQPNDKRSVYNVFRPSNKIELDASFGGLRGQLANDNFIGAMIPAGDFKVSLSCEGGWEPFTPQGQSFCNVVYSPTIN